LIIVAQSIESNAIVNYDLICDYSMQQVQKAIDDIWDLCQETPYARVVSDCRSVIRLLLLSSSTYYRYNNKNQSDTPAYCYVFTHLADGNYMTPCSKFNGMVSDVIGIDFSSIFIFRMIQLFETIVL